MELLGSAMFSFFKRFKSLKTPLKRLNEQHFNHISERVSRTDADLDILQTALHGDPNNQQLALEDKRLWLHLLQLKSAEKLFFGQKLKCDFLKDSDRGTSFFHAMMSQKHSLSFISAIHRGDGSLTSSEIEVGVEFVQFFQNLYGSSRPTLSLDNDVVFPSRAFPIAQVRSS